jgi:SAM-dependent methyltransferase
VEVQSSYDRVAAEYAAEFQNEMDGKPFDRRMLDWLIEKVAGLGPICDLGCGPGQVARYLHGRGAEAHGIDLSAEMVRQAARLNPAIGFQQGDMLELGNVADETFGGIAAFYAIHHFSHADAARAFGELARVLRPGGVLLVAFHVGDETIHTEEWWGKAVDLDFTFLRSAEVGEWLATAGLTLEEAMERDPYAGVEYGSRRGYVFARKPGRGIA